MKKLSEREEEIMSILWNKGPLFVREIVESMPEPRPHFNTVATFLKGLETKGWVKKSFSETPTAIIPLRSLSLTDSNP